MKSDKGRLHVICRKATRKMQNFQKKFDAVQLYHGIM